MLGHEALLEPPWDGLGVARRFCPGWKPEATAASKAAPCPELPLHLAALRLPLTRSEDHLKHSCSLEWGFLQKVPPPHSSIHQHLTHRL